MSEFQEHPSPFEPRFHRAERRLRGRAMLRAMAAVLPWLQGAWLLFFVGGRLGFWELPLTWAFALLTVALLLTTLWSARRAPTGRDAALVLDRRLGTRELVTAAHEAAGNISGTTAGTPNGTTTALHPAVELTRGRAAAALAGDAVARALPLTAWGRFRPVLLGFAAALLAFFLPPLGEQASATLTAPDPAVKDTAEILAEELAPLAAEVAELERPEAKEALARLEEMVEEMRRGALPTSEDALVALAETEEALTDLRQEMSAEELGDAVQEMGTEPLAADLTAALSEMDRDALRDSLRQMAQAMSSEEARQRGAQQQLASLAEKFDQLADALEQSGRQDLADVVRELARALEAGDLKRAAELLASAEMLAAMEFTAESGTCDRVGNSMAELLQTARYLLGREKPTALANQGQSQPGTGSGPMPGTGSTNREVEGYATGNRMLRDRQTTETSSRTGEFEALYESERMAAENLTDVRSQGQMGAEGELLSEEGRALGMEGASSLPLQPFSGSAAGAPERAKDLESVPLGYRGLVREYFERNDQSRNGQGR